MINNTKYAIREDKCKRNFVGTYKRTGAKLSHADEPTIRLVIGTRLRTTPAKPRHFLLLFEGRNQPAIYFSSLYPTKDPSKFEMEHDGIRYEIVLNTDTAMVMMLNQFEQAA